MTESTGIEQMRSLPPAISLFACACILAIGRSDVAVPVPVPVPSTWHCCVMRHCVTPLLTGDTLCPKSSGVHAPLRSIPKLFKLSTSHFASILSGWEPCLVAFGGSSFLYDLQFVFEWPTAPHKLQKLGQFSEFLF